VQLIEPITGIAQAFVAASFEYDQPHRIYKEDGLVLARALHFLADELSASNRPSSQVWIC
jgi:spermidine synthase